jgi:fluoride exporter
MSAGGWIAVALLGGLMAVARFALDALLSDHPVQPFPLGILAVNLLGTMVLGVVAGAALSGEALTIVAGGVTGSFTTFSTWMLDSERLLESERPRLAGFNLGLSLFAGLLAVALGHWLGGAL